MACYHPITAWFSRDVNPTGKRSLTFSPKYAEQPDDPLEIACGQCVGCRLERSRQWALRCMHEASLHEDNCFLTLTFSPESLATRENPWSLDVRDFQKFMKRLRKHISPRKVRFFHCGEYGEKYARPHYHACLFGYDFPDKELLRIDNGHRLYISDTLNQLWPFGFSTIGSVTFESAAYVARYIMKKITGDSAEDHYTWIDTETGELHKRAPEYTTMSRRPGIGRDWIEKYKSDVYPKDFVTVNGRAVNPPKFYDRYLLEHDPFLYDEIKEKRVEKGLTYQDNNTPDRLAVREKVKLRQLEKLPRNVDSEN